MATASTPMRTTFEPLRARPRVTLLHQELLSPATRADLTGFPPLLLQVGTNEVLLDNSTRLAQRAWAAGVDVVFDVTADVPHVFQAFTGVLDEADQALDRAALFLTQHLSRDEDRIAPSPSRARSARVGARDRRGGLARAARSRGVVLARRGRRSPPNNRVRGSSGAIFAASEPASTGAALCTPRPKHFEELLGHQDVSTTMITTHVLNRGGRGVRSPLDGVLGHERAGGRPSGGGGGEWMEEPRWARGGHDGDDRQTWPKRLGDVAACPGGGDRQVLGFRGSE